MQPLIAIQREGAAGTSNGWDAYANVVDARRVLLKNSTSVNRQSSSLRRFMAACTSLSLQDIGSTFNGFGTAALWVVTRQLCCFIQLSRALGAGTAWGRIQVGGGAGSTV